ncbi:hypothetical protein [Rhodovulum marinum]|uniref:Uncharacterized protein n=1 Tax=Rhodovulum marinum TaxID=320662 RepID=A0A4R2Q723_9RHOB|nr:hypothetical protein [Rhodovulum marinum]TCP44329.1 hypothetical protein EV662_101421 [Rhodovulum marinum]
MTTTFPALASLLTTAGALALMVKGATRWRAARRAPRSPATPPPMPREPAPPPSRAPRRTVARPDGTCAGCGTPIPGTDSHCGICARKQTASPDAGRTALLHWAFTIVVLTMIYGAGYLLAP